MLPLRSSGVLMHITSLPSAHGIGDLGPEAYAFADFLAQTHQRVWQILPLTPTATTSWNDPYHSISAFAGNPLMISPELLVDEGRLQQSDLKDKPEFPQHEVDFEQVTKWKSQLLMRAFKTFNPDAEPEFAAFRSANRNWLEDYALFAALHEQYAGKHWSKWPTDILKRTPEAIAKAREDLQEHILRIIFDQYLFDKQWKALRAYCRERYIAIFGDMPIYVDHDSADLWRQPHLWKLDSKYQPTVVAGVPPDYFSATGQLWESPIYDWDAHQEQDFSWWINRIHRNLDLFDILRIDHFRGLVAYWEVPQGEETALNGKWVDAPIQDFLKKLYASRSSLALVAEDLGVITPDVRETMRQYDLPGMKILQFAFGDNLAENPYAPHNIEKHSVAYTGTHDNNPIQAWYEEEADVAVRTQLSEYMGKDIRRDELHWDMVRLVMGSRAQLAVVPTQDLLGLGMYSRMNRPGNLSGNWHWRMAPGAITDSIVKRFSRLVKMYGRG